MKKTRLVVLSDCLSLDDCYWPPQIWSDDGCGWWQIDVDTKTGIAYTYCTYSNECVRLGDLKEEELP